MPPDEFPVTYLKCSGINTGIQGWRNEQLVPVTPMCRTGSQWLRSDLEVTFLSLWLTLPSLWWSQVSFCYLYDFVGFKSLPWPGSFLPSLEAMAFHMVAQFEEPRAGSTDHDPGSGQHWRTSWNFPNRRKRREPTVRCRPWSSTQDNWRCFQTPGDSRPYIIWGLELAPLHKPLTYNFLISAPETWSQLPAGKEWAESTWYTFSEPINPFSSQHLESSFLMCRISFQKQGNPKLKGTILLFLRYQVWLGSLVGAEKVAQSPSCHLPSSSSAASTLPIKDMMGQVCRTFPDPSWRAMWVSAEWLNILFLKARRKDQGSSGQHWGWVGWVWMAHLATSCLCLLTGGNCSPKGHKQKKQLTYNSGFNMHSYSHGHGAHKSPQRDKFQDRS